MGYSRVEIIDDPLEGLILHAEGEARKGGAYIARITGTDPKYKYARQFLGQKRYRGKHNQYVNVPVADLGDWEILEIRAGGSWKNDYRGFSLFFRDAAEPTLADINEEELRLLLAAKLKGEPLPHIPGVTPEPPPRT